MYREFIIRWSQFDTHVTWKRHNSSHINYKTHSFPRIPRMMTERQEVKRNIYLIVKQKTSKCNANFFQYVIESAVPLCKSCHCANYPTISTVHRIDYATVDMLVALLAASCCLWNIQSDSSPDATQEKRVPYTYKIQDSYHFGGSRISSSSCIFVTDNSMAPIDDDMAGNTDPLLHIHYVHH
uniref:Uncharacterized protein n=1 Tax=Romanomermis culicivorax TaxID=13658 RepID=A0A915KYY2_ROMCU